MKRQFFMLFFSVLMCCALHSLAQQPNQPRTSGKPAYQLNMDTLKTIRNNNDSFEAARIAERNKPVRDILFSFGGILSFPQRDFKNVSNIPFGYGFDISLLVNVDRSKRSVDEWKRRFINIYYGAYVQYIKHNGLRDEYDYDDNVYSNTVTTKVENNMTSFGVLARLELLPGPVKLFGEASAGGRMLNGVSKIDIESVPNAAHASFETVNSSDKNFLRNQYIANYAYGGGLRFQNHVGGFEFKCLYVHGTRATYVDMTSIKIDPSTRVISFNELKSRTDMLLFHIGYTVHF